MTANRKQAALAIAIVFALFAVSFGFDFVVPEMLVALAPLSVLIGLVWFGHEVLSSLRRIEAAVANDSELAPEFSHGS